MCLPFFLCLKATYFLGVVLFLSEKLIIYSNEFNILALNKNKFYFKLQTQLKKEAQVHKSKNSTPFVDSLGFWHHFVACLHWSSSYSCR